MVNSLPTKQETQVWSLGQEDLLEKGMAIHSSILVWKIAWTEEPGGLQSMGFQRVGHTWVWLTHTQPKLTKTLYKPFHLIRVWIKDMD